MNNREALIALLEGKTLIDERLTTYTLVNNEIHIRAECGYLVKSDHIKLVLEHKGGDFRIYQKPRIFEFEAYMGEMDDSYSQTHSTYLERKLRGYFSNFEGSREDISNNYAKITKFKVTVEELFEKE